MRYCKRCKQPMAETETSDSHRRGVKLRKLCMDCAGEMGHGGRRHDLVDLLSRPMGARLKDAYQEDDEENG